MIWMILVMIFSRYSFGPTKAHKSCIVHGVDQLVQFVMPQMQQPRYGHWFDSDQDVAATCGRRILRLLRSLDFGITS